MGFSDCFLCYLAWRSLAIMGQVTGVWGPVIYTLWKGVMPDVLATMEAVIYRVSLS